MKTSRWSLSLVLVTSLWLALAAGGGWWVWRARETAKREMAAVERVRQERDWLLRQAPQPTEENERAVREDLAAAEQVLAALRAGLSPPAVPPEEARRPLDAFFELAAYGERLRVLATRAGVELPAGSALGFAAYVREGPEPAALDVVRQQRADLESLLQQLFEARPSALLAVQRERPEGLSGTGVDYLPVAAATGGSLGAHLRTRRYLLEFAGQTAALRQFLNALAASERPVVVRRVQVEPMPEATGRPGAPAGGGATVQPVVLRPFSKFSVLLEYVELTPSAVASSS